MKLPNKDLSGKTSVVELTKIAVDLTKIEIV